MRERCSPSTRLPTAAIIRLTWWYLPSVSVSLSDAEHADLTTRSGQAARQAIGNRYNDRDLTKEDVKHIRQVTDKAHDTYREIAFRKNYKPAP